MTGSPAGETIPVVQQQPTKPGIKSTEFWMALVVVVGGAVAAVYADKQWAKVVGMAVSGLVAAGYGFQRAMVKRGGGA